MRVIDSIFAWAIFLAGFAYVIVVGYWHPRGTVLDTPGFWIVVAMINFLRRNQREPKLARLRVLSITANLMAFALEFFRFGLFATRTVNIWGSQYIFSELRANISWWVPYFVIAISALVETVCSVRRTGTAEPRSYA
jgi:hypothetical protein